MDMEVKVSAPVKCMTYALLCVGGVPDGNTADQDYNES